MFKLNTTKGIYETVREMAVTPIQYEVRIPDGNWYPYFGHYENQKWGAYDTDSCWALSAINCLEDELEWLWKNGQFGQEAKDFFTKNGYIDADGDFSLSERHLEIMSGMRDNGNNQMNAWILMQQWGAIPRSMLVYTQEEAQKCPNREAFLTDYFDESYITTEMYTLGQEFLKYVNLSRQWIGTPWTTPSKDILRAALKQAPLQIGVPVPKGISKWNSPFIQYDGGTTADHAIELYAIDDNGEYLIFDQYEPHIKTLSSDYYIPFVTQGIATAVPSAAPNPVVQDAASDSFWTKVMNWFNGIMSGLVGSAKTRAQEAHS